MRAVALLMCLWGGCLSILLPVRAECDPQQNTDGAGHNPKCGASAVCTSYTHEGKTVHMCGPEPGAIT